MLTIPRSIVKSYTKDLSLPIFELVIQHRLASGFLHCQLHRNVMILGSATSAMPIHAHVISGEIRIAVFQHGFWLRGVQP